MRVCGGAGLLYIYLCWVFFCMIFDIVLSLQEGYAHYVGEWGWEGAGQVYCIFIYVGFFLYDF
jgi:hypothetical protein